MPSDDGASGSPGRYLFDGGHASHPVIEYKADTTENSGGSAIPSFVLDVTWPRVVVFYHASSPLCRAFKEKFVLLARATRHRSERVPLTFHAVSCGANEDVCAEYSVKEVPVVMAFDSGKIAPVIVKRTDDNSIDPEQLAEVLGIELDEVVPESGLVNQEALGKNLMAANFIDDSKGGGGGDFAAAAAVADEMRSIHSSSSEVFTDASNAFMGVLEFGTFEEFAKDKALPAERRNVLREFLDLLHWSLPSQWKLHDLINDLRNDFDSVCRSHEDMIKVLYRHKPPANSPEWSTSCDHFNRGDIDGGLDRQEGLQGFTCGFWRLLHISSIGVSEQHTSVMGDRERVRPSHVATVMRDYVETYYVGSCMRCGRAIIESVDECRYDLCGRMADVHADTVPTSPGWKDLAMWMWRVHNDVRQQGFAGTPWPLAKDCDGCQGALGWNLDDVHTHLKHNYWPPGIQNPRIVVLKRRHGRLARFRARASDSWGVVLAMCCLGLAAWFSRYRFRFRQTGSHKKSYLTLQNGDEVRSERRSRRGRHRNDAARYKSRGSARARSRLQTTFLDS